MGAKLSLLAPSAPTIAISSYVDILNSIQYVEVISNSRFLKTIRAVDQRTGCLIVIKILIKPSNANYTLNLQSVTESLAKEASLLAASAACSRNVLPWSNIIETDRAGYLIRQHVKANLYDRLSIRPFLQPIEKLFLAYQMLRTIAELHKLRIHHGDLRLENFLVTSWNWLMLTDLASAVKPTYIPEDNPNQFSFYFDSSDRRVCYLAPERLQPRGGAAAASPSNNYDDDGKFTGRDTVTDAMDHFSLGCVIAELYMEGESLFNLASLFKYKKGEYVPDLAGVTQASPGIAEIITGLISISPDDRPSSAHILAQYTGSVFPAYFDSFLYGFMAELNDSDKFVVPMGNNNVSPSDLKVDFIYSRFDKIAQSLGYGYGSGRAASTTATSLAAAASGSSGSSRTDVVPLRLSLPGMPPSYQIKPSDALNSDGASLIIVNLVFSLLKTLKRPSSKVKACELILALSERISDECKLDRSLPYLCSILDEYIETVSSSSSSLSKGAAQDGGIQAGAGSAGPAAGEGSSSSVVAFALKAITTLLLSCSSITPLNTFVFPEYIVPKLNALMNSPFMSRQDKILIKGSVAFCLPHLATSAKRFWLLSQTFSQNGAADSNGAAGGPSGPSVGAAPGAAPGADAPFVSKDQLDFEFENLFISILSDANSSVKMNLVSSILPLCQFFGIDKTNDLVLPHLISCLNDPDTKLRLSFLDSLLALGPFVGVLSFEQYLLPLLLQTLCDSELLVVAKVLEIFNLVIRTRLINPKTEFNALNIYNEILSSCLFLVLHPNEWIRQAVLNVILAISDNLTAADRYCFLFSLIKTYLSYDVSVFDWNTLYPCLAKPLSRASFDLAITWSLNATSKSLFWKQSDPSMPASSASSVAAPHSKNGGGNLGRSVYALPSSEVVFPSPNGKGATLPLSQEDKQWLFKLKSVGLEHRDLWKIFVFRDFIYRYSKSKSSATHLAQGSKFELINHAEVFPRNVFFELCFKSEPIAQTSTSETRFYATAASGAASSGPVAAAAVTAAAAATEGGSGSGGGDNESITSRRGSNSLVLPNFGVAKASVQTVQANVFGELEGNSSQTDGAGNQHHGGNHRHHHHVHSTKDVNSTHKVFSVNNQKVITANLRHSYTGFNPYILNFLNTIEFNPSFDSFGEFGPTIRQKRASLHTRNGKRAAASGAKGSSTGTGDALGGTGLKGACIAQINTNSSTNEIDSINALALCDSSEFFVTGSESGLLRIWDTSKLERNIMVKNANLVLSLGSPITCIKFIPRRYAFAVATMDGAVRVYKVEVTRNKSTASTSTSASAGTGAGGSSGPNKILKYNKCLLIREYKANVAETGYILDLEFMINSSTTLMVGVTSTAKILGLDLIKMEKVMELANPLFYGTPTTFIVDSKNCWLLLGTSKGNLCLWDLRFEVLLKSWTINSPHHQHTETSAKHGSVTFPIKKLIGILGEKKSPQQQSSQQHVKDSYSDAAITSFALIGGTGDSDVTLWDIPSFTCKQVFSSQTPDPRVKLYTLEECSESVDSEISKLLSTVDLAFDSNPPAADPAMTCLSGAKARAGGGSLLVSATAADKRIIVWNLQDAEKSVSLNSDGKVHFTNSAVNSTLTLTNERSDTAPGAKAKAATSSPSTKCTRHQDIITGIAIAHLPAEILISTDRNGYIHLYQ